MVVPGGEDVYATLLLTDSYLPGALVLAHSLRDAGATKKLAILVTLETVSVEVVTQLKSVYDYVIPVKPIRNQAPANLYLMDRPDLHSAFTKINLWKQTQFRKIVYIDADVVAFRAPDELFALPHPFSAAPDIGWPDLFNTGVMVLTPDMGEYYAMLAMAERGISFDGADQGLLNMHFKNSYNRLSFSYNVTPSAHYQYIPAYRHFQSTINMVHFIGADKPWFQGRDSHSGSGPFNEMVGRWWAVYDRHYRREATRSMPSISASTPNLTTTSAPEISAPTQTAEPAPELVQYFVKGEYQPKISYIVPIGEPAQRGGDFHGQNDQFDSQESHREPFLHLHRHEHDHPHHNQPHYGQSEQAPHNHDQSQSDSSHSHHQPPHEDHPPQSDSFATAQGSHTEAREEQAQGHQQWAQHSEPEHKPELPPQEPSWDAQRHPPPPNSKPEAANFPQMHYEMSSDTAPFVPPPRYPSPPKNMWYEVPKERPAPPAAQPRAIFPWETNRPRPSRVFAEPAPEPTSESSDGSKDTGASVGGQAPGSVSPATSTSHATPITPSDPWSSFPRSNAWDDVPQIERYVDRLQQRHRRTKSQGTNITSPSESTKESKDAQDDDIQGQRRGSKLTDFPSEVERPSLPVTPAPIRRPRFWGGAPGASLGAGEDEEDNELLPTAEGVPTQSQWDPLAQLQKLAHEQSELLLQKFGASGEELKEGDETEKPTGPEGKETIQRSPSTGSEDAKVSTYIAQSATVHSPQPVKPGSGTSLAMRLQDEHDSVPRAAVNSKNPTVVEEPSYHGPGAAFEKGEEFMTQDTPAPPDEEEKDVLLS